MYPFAQQGIALLLLAILVFLTAAAVIVRSSDSRAYTTQRQHNTQLALAKAKQALLGYSVEDHGSARKIRPGELPCPDADGNGKIDAFGVDYQGSRCTTLLGWLPFVTVKTEDIRDGYGEKLWYAVSEDFYNKGGLAREAVLNSMTEGQLILDQHKVAALLIAPGPVLNGQQRPLDNNYLDVQHYLEGRNADGDNHFVSDEHGNDIVLAITVDELMRLAEWRAVQAASQALISYYQQSNRQGQYLPYAEADGICDADSQFEKTQQGFLPIAALPGCPYEPISHLPPWFIKNRWHELVVYSVAPACAGNTHIRCSGLGFLTFDQQSTIYAVVAAAGKALDQSVCNNNMVYRQSRPEQGVSHNICDYLEGTENTDNDAVYAQDAASNDRFIVIAEEVL